MIQITNKLPPTQPNITGNTDELLVLGGLVSTIVITLVFAFTVILSSARVVAELLVALSSTVVMTEVGSTTVVVASPKHETKHCSMQTSFNCFTPL